MREQTARPLSLHRAGRKLGGGPWDSIIEGDDVANAATGEQRGSIEALFDNFMRLVRDGLSTLLVPWLGIAAIDFGFVALAVLSVVMAGTADPGTAGGTAVQAIGFVQAIAVLTLRVALLRTLRDVGLHGASAVGSPGAVFRDVARHIVPAFLITVVAGLVVGIGFVLCVLPGLVALFFLAFAPYLVVAQGESILDGMRRSAEWAWREWPLLLSAVVVAMIGGGLMACVMGAIGGLITGTVAAVPSALVGGWIVNTVVGYVAFLWWGAVYVTAESREQVETLQKTAPEGAVVPGSEKHRRGADTTGGGRRGPKIYEAPDGGQSSGEW